MPKAQAIQINWQFTGGAGIMQVDRTADCFGGTWFKLPLSTEVWHPRHIWRETAFQFAEELALNGETYVVSIYEFSATCIWQVVGVQVEQNRCKDRALRKPAPQLSTWLNRHHNCQKNINPVHHLLVFKFLTNTPNLSSRCSQSSSRENPRDRGERKMKNPRTRTHTSFILAWFCIWWGRWLITGPLSLTPLTVWPLAGLQQPRRWQRESAQPWNQMPFLLQPSVFPGFGTRSEYACLRILRLDNAVGISFY